ncbi:MvaI/BcnI family restriction endonuclease [Schwartzia succinivorans]|jgi:hypothetical protein|uniref:MvaI/BcnI restriction endonuclease family protein n=1 Tax=Schwartzia succinivorans DSM 10502 TaxID=1123243 RepID=A0A1M4Y976_9FIRM|nr:MvaI/BcnI family restriction endonuclease [Schwartzia succinivorans]SHF02387.1 MvaI/BcnI restriction endonuclease family protein [Schwartzia succinivorans DSM 10502]
MIFTPTFSEASVIARIHQFTNADYTIIRVTPTMVAKNNIDANDNFRRIFEDANIVDYSSLNNGAVNKVSIKATFIQFDKTSDFTINMYRVTNNRGDRRFSIEKIAEKVRNHEIEIDDLLYIFIVSDDKDNNHVYMINTTHNVPSDDFLRSILSGDEITNALNELRPILSSIVNNGPYENNKGEGKIADKDVGDTFEFLVGIQTNNFTGADYRGLIEFKTKRSNTLDTLFSLRPCFDGTPIAEIEHIDRNRVSAFTRKYGYFSDAHPEMKSLYITIAAQPSPRNNQNFYLNVNYDTHRVELIHIEENESVVTAFWDFGSLRDELVKKHPSTLWINSVVEREGAEGVKALFKYNKIYFSRSPNFTTFINLIERGIISYDWRGYTTPEGKYSGKNHGNAWRINKRYTNMLFDSMEELSL